MHALRQALRALRHARTTPAAEDDLHHHVHNASMLQDRSMERDGFTVQTHSVVAARQRLDPRTASAYRLGSASSPATSGKVRRNKALLALNDSRPESTWARQWLAAAARGYCGQTRTDMLGNCDSGDSGDLRQLMRIRTQDWQSLSATASRCLKACSLCSGCKYVTLSLKRRDCSWYRRCDLTQLIPSPDFISAGMGSIPFRQQPQDIRCHDQCLEKYGVLPQDAWRVAYLHIPKCGGTSVLHALSGADVAACNVVTGGSQLCPCVAERSIPERSVGCLRRVSVIVGEQPFFRMKRIVKTQLRHQWLWMATVREPRGWFFSALAQWCTHTRDGSRSPRCRPGTTAAQLLRAGWYSPDGSRRQWGLAHRNMTDPPISYFSGANLQSEWLGNIFLEQNWVICSLDRLNSSVAAISRLLGSNLRDDANHAHARRPLLQTLHRHGLKQWRPRSALEESVDWGELRQFHLLDEGLYHQVHGAGCLAHTSSPWLRGQLEAFIAPAVWL